MLGLGGCSDAVDQAAKKRIFSPEDPPQAVAAASEKLPPEYAADRPAITRRILGMRAGEATERIGAHFYSANILWEWTTGGRNVRLKETRELVSSVGGVSGDFHAKIFNTNNLGLEVMRVGGAVYARSTYGKNGAGRFRERRRDRGMAERIRDESFGGIRDFDQLFLGRLKLTSAGTSTYEGRLAWKYTVSLAPNGAKPDKSLPPLLHPKTKPDSTTELRQKMFELRAPKTLQGEVLVDQETSVVVKARLDGRLTAKTDAAESELHLVLDSAMSKIGKQPAIAAPKEFLPDEDKPDGIAEALTRFGIARASTDAGVPVPSGGAELPDEPE
jgi:hypothetical protein